MTGALPAQRADTTPLGVLRQQFAPNARDEDLAYFAAVARHLDVDPWLGHICLANFGGIWRPTLTVAGRRWIAQRTGRLRGIVGPQWCGPRRYDPDGGKLPLEWLELWDDDDAYPYAARCFVYVAGWDEPANGTVKWAELARWKDRDKGILAATWATMPSHMLGKAAESLALRRGFSEVQAAVAYLGDDDETQILREVEADAATAAAELPPPTGHQVDRQLDRGRRRRGDPESPPASFYDDLPEARGYR